MKLLRISLAILILRGAGIIAGVISGELMEGRHSQPPLRPVDRMVGSLVVLTVCVFWFTWRGA